MKNSNDSLIKIMAIGLLLIACSSIIFCLGWIIYKSGNFLFSYFGSQIQFNLIYTIISLTIISVLGVFLSITVKSRKSSITASSKACKYEEDSRWYNDYMGDY